MQENLDHFDIIDTQQKLSVFYELNKNAAWMAFDTEFIGEKRFDTLLCLIQVATDKGFFIIDPIVLEDFGLFFDLIEDPKILKITHAGENDYRILAQNWGVVPQNIFDTQLAAGFINYNYPISYSKLVEKELGAEINKSYAATNWDMRPLKIKQLEYALTDVVHLYDLYANLKEKLTAAGRYNWVLQELKSWQVFENYERDPYKDVITGSLIQGLNKRKQILLLRLHRWRFEEAKRLNCAKENVLPLKHIAPIVRGIDEGKHVLLDSRIISNRIIEQHWETFKALYNRKPDEEELELLTKVSQVPKEDPIRDVSLELIHSLIKYESITHGIAPQLVLNKSDINNLEPEEIISTQIGDDWRAEFLGKTLISWLNARKQLNINTVEDKIILSN